MTTKYEIDKILSKFNETTPGCAVGVFQKGEVIHAKGYGRANLEYNQPINTNSVFRIASLSKHFTAFCVYILIKEKKVSLEDDIRNYFSEMPKYDEIVKIKDIINHRSGIRDYLSLYFSAGRTPREFDTQSFDDLLNLITRQKGLNYSPGSEFLYSNSNYLLLAELIKRVSGLTLREFAEARLFKPLGMSSTHFHDNYLEIVPNRATGYRKTKDETFEICETTSDIIGDGGIFTCIDDLFKWSQIFQSNLLFSSEELPQLLYPDWERINEQGDIYGYGLNLSTYKNNKVIRHAGGFVGFQTNFLFFPEKDLSIYILGNYGNTNIVELAYPIADLFLSQDDLNHDLGSDKTEDKIEQDINLDHDWIASYFGYYHRITELYQFLINEEESKKYQLIVNGGWFSFDLIPIGSNKFKSTTGIYPIELELREIENKKILQVKILGSGSIIKYSSIDPFIPEKDTSSSFLKNFTGKYYSEELDASCYINVEDDKLILHRMRDENRLLFLTADTTLTVKDGCELQFKQENGKIIGFTFSTFRMRGIQYKKEGFS